MQGKGWGLVGCWEGRLRGRVGLTPGFWVKRSGPLSLGSRVGPSPGCAGIEGSAVPARWPVLGRVLERVQCPGESTERPKRVGGATGLRAAFEE